MSRFPASRTDPAAYDHVVELPIFYNDLDPNRHLNNVAFGRFFEHARVLSNNAAGVLSGVHILVARVTIDYLAEGFIGTPLRVSTRLAALGRSSLVEEQVAWQGDRCIGLCETVLVHVGGGDGPTPWPDELRAGLGPLIHSAAESG